MVEEKRSCKGCNHIFSSPFGYFFSSNSVMNTQSTPMLEEEEEEEEEQEEVSVVGVRLQDNERCNLFFVEICWIIFKDSPPSPLHAANARHALLEQKVFSF